MNKNESKSTKQSKAKKNSEMVVIRVSEITRNALHTDLKRINNKMGRKVTLDEYLSVARTAISQEHIVELQKATWSNEDREKLTFEIYKKENKGVTFDEFKGLLLRGQLIDFIGSKCVHLF